MTAPHLFLWADDSETELRSELRESFPRAEVQSVRQGLLKLNSEIPAGQPPPRLVFARQWLPCAAEIRAESIRAWCDAVCERLIELVPEGAPWLLHVEPQYTVRNVHRIGARAWHTAGRGGGVSEKKLPEREGGLGGSEAGRNRCNLIRAGILDSLRRRRRHLLRRLEEIPRPFLPSDSLVQVLLTSPEEGFLSVTPAPLPFEGRCLLSPFPKGEVPVASDKEAPSRAFAKLVEAEKRMGRAIGAGERCVDLGASPGSWSYVAVQRDAKVIALDRSPLREDLMGNRNVTFQTGDAFRFSPPHPVDWLLCDVIAEPDRTADLLVNWLRNRWCKQFIVTIKLRDLPAKAALGLLKRELPQLTGEFFLTRLCANKKEVCAFGWV